MKIRAAVLGVFLTTLGACQVAPESAQVAEKSCVTDNNGNYQAVLSDPQLGWSECFDHNSAGLFASVTSQIKQLAQAQDFNSKEFDDLLYYLRAFSYYGSIKNLTEQDWLGLNDSLQAVAALPIYGENQGVALRIKEHLAVALYQYGWQEKSKVDPTFITQTQAKLILDINPTASSAAEQYQILEAYRTVGFLTYRARRNKDLKAALIAPENGLLDALTKGLTSQKQNNWQLNNNVWALANLHYLLPEEPQKSTDKLVSEFVFSHPDLTKTEQKQLFSQNYLVNSFRYHEQCDDDFKAQCLIPTIDEALPVNHTCSDTLFIRATAMTEDELAVSCNKLTSQEAFFHKTINSQNQPVSNDLNTKLRVIIFDNYSEYNRWGQLLFNIGTDNGGMYIEGTPEKVGNQATFFSFEAFWKQPEFDVWNLNHEYVHYLDGRFVKFGTFGHYPSHLVWWSEGLAEYISVQKQNKKAFELLNKKEQKDWPTLSDIFATTYSDGTDRVYRWSYQAIRFIFENYPTQGEQMAAALKRDDFDAYSKLLNNFANQHQAEFLAWQLAKQPAKQEPVQEINTVKTYKANPLYRYLYRTYLRPAHLPITEQHKHFSNWG
jgi:microbial collagenase